VRKGIAEQLARLVLRQKGKPVDTALFGGRTAGVRRGGRGNSMVGVPEAVAVE